MHAVLGRQHGYVKFAQSVLVPTRRSLSTGAVLRREGKDAPRKEGILARLKDIFHRTSDGKGHEKDRDTCEEIASNRSADKSSISDKDNINSVHHDIFSRSPVKLQIREMSNFAPRSPNPPIREPGMPEKKDKKDDKKERKIKKPVIRTGDQSAAYSTTANMSVDKEASKDVSTSSFPQQTAASVTDAEQEEGLSESSKSLRRMMKISPDLMEETNIVDSDYNIPPGTSCDAELAAWKDLVSRSKIPSHAQNVEAPPIAVTQTLNPVSIRPEPPEPKLDVQMVRSIDEMTKPEVEIDDSVSDSATVESLNVKPSNASNAKKMDNQIKKLHTKVRYDVRHRSTKSDNTVKGSETLDKDRTGRSEDSKSEGTDVAKSLPKHNTSHVLPTDPNVWSNQEALAGIETDFSSDFNVSNKEAEFSLSHSHEDSSEHKSKLPTSVMISPRVSRRDEMSQSEGKSQMFREDYYYASEDDTFDPMEMYVDEAADSEHLPPILKEPRKKEPIVKMADGEERKPEDRDESEYVRVPGDPYPYSKEHFEKWRRPRGNIAEGHTMSDLARKEYLAAKEEYPGAVGNTNSSDKTIQDKQAPIREMSHDSHAATENIASVSPHSLNGMNVMNMIKGAEKSETPLSGKLIDEKRPTSRICVSSLDQRIIPDCLQFDNSADSHAMEQWRNAFSRLNKNVNIDENALKREDNVAKGLPGDERI